MRKECCQIKNSKHHDFGRFVWPCVLRTVQRKEGNVARRIMRHGTNGAYEQQSMQESVEAGFELSCGTRSENYWFVRVIFLVRISPNSRTTWW